MSAPTTAPPTTRPAWEAYRDHVLTCRIAERAGYCRECERLDEAAAAEARS